MAESFGGNPEGDAEREERSRAEIEREEERLQLLEQVKEFGRSFGHWSTREYAEHGDRMRAASHALGVIESVLQDDGERMKRQLESMAFEMGYRIEKGRFEDSASPELLADIERSIEASRRQARENLNP